MTDIKVDAVILAGGDGEVIDPTQRFKGLVPIAGKPLVEWVVDAFRDAERVGEIAVVIPTAENLGGWVDRVDKLVVSDRDFMDNAIAGAAAFRSDRPVIIATGDIPLLTGAAIDSFIEAGLATGSEFVYPLVHKESVEGAYPGSERTYFKLKTGRFTGGNAMIVDPKLLPAARDLGQRLFNDRKNAIALVRAAGIGFVVRFVLGRLVPEDLADKIHDLLGGSGAAVVLDDPSIAMDVDKPADLRLVEPRLLARS
ncbi:MAG TPA: nucleotidyltransferase family protein [Coriobacteriia bacterium]